MPPKFPSWLNNVNAALFGLLLLSLLANIVIGSMMFTFAKHYYQRSNAAIIDRAILKHHDSLQDIRGDANLKGQIHLQEQMQVIINRLYVSDSLTLKNKMR